MTMDVNKDGVVSWDDFEHVIKKFKATGVLQPEELTSLENALKVAIGMKIHLFIGVKIYNV